MGKKRRKTARATPRKRTPRPIPPVIRMLVYCVNPEYREDYKRLYQGRGLAARHTFLEKYYQPYLDKPYNPAALSDDWWISLAKRGGRFDGEEGNRDFYFLARLAGGVENPDLSGEIVYNASDPVTVIPCGWDHEKP